MKSKKDREEMERLQSKIVELTQELNQTVIENVSQTLPQDGELDEVENTVPGSVAQELAKQNETYQAKMEAMRREIKILRDCQSKLTIPKKKRGLCSQLIVFMIGLLFIGLVFVGGMVHLYGWEMVSDSLVNMQVDLQREVNVLVKAAGPMIDDCWRWMDGMKQIMTDEGTSGGGDGVYKAEV